MELINIQNKTIGNSEVNSVDARELHEFLEVDTTFNDWFKRRLIEYKFVINSDFCSYKSESTGGRPRLDYALSIGMAKELSMVERNEKGREARKYFIKCEQRAKELALPDFSNPAVAARAWAIQYEKNAQLENKVKRDAPKVEFHDAVAIADDCVDIGGMAKLTKKLGRNKLFSVMRFNGILMHDNTPYQTFINRGYFKVVEKRSEKPVGFAIYLVTVVTGKGQAYIIKNLDQWLRNYEEA